MKKSPTKPKLGRETLRILQRPDLRVVLGGEEGETQDCQTNACAFNAMDGYIRG